MTLALWHWQDDVLIFDTACGVAEAAVFDALTPLAEMDGGFFFAWDNPLTGQCTAFGTRFFMQNFDSKQALPHTIFYLQLWPNHSTHVNSSSVPMSYWQVQATNHMLIWRTMVGTNIDDNVPLIQHLLGPMLPRAVEPPAQPVPQERCLHGPYGQWLQQGGHFFNRYPSTVGDGVTLRSGATTSRDLPSPDCLEDRHMPCMGGAGSEYHDPDGQPEDIAISPGVEGEIVGDCRALDSLANMELQDEQDELPEWAVPDEVDVMEEEPNPTRELLSAALRSHFLSELKLNTTKQTRKEGAEPATEQGWRLIRWPAFQKKCRESRLSKDAVIAYVQTPACANDFIWPPKKDGHCGSACFRISEAMYVDHMPPGP